MDKPNSNSSPTPPSEGSQRGRASTLLMAVLPLVLLAALVAIFLWNDPTRSFRGQFPPIEELAVQRIVLTPGNITMDVINDGPDAITIAQVQVDDAYWDHAVEPSREIHPLGKAKVIIPYPWVKDEAHAIVLVTATGVTFEAEIAVAAETPSASLGMVGLFAVLGLYVGVIPVAIGLLWYPAIRRAGPKWIRFCLYLTVGLLVFLGFDAIEESLELAKEVPNVFNGFGLLVIGALGAVIALTAVQNSLNQRKHSASSGPLTMAYMVALGIGLHNLGEGLAIGAAYAIGNLSLGATLVIGFTLHNTTEGLAIVAPLSSTATRVKQLILLGILAGVPTIFGAWIGGFAYSPTWNLLFLAIGAGAIFQVAWQITAQLGGKDGSIVKSITLTDAVGLLAGFLIMYVTGRLVIA